MPAAIRPDTGFTANTLGGNDDGSTGAVAIRFTLGYFGNNYSDLYVNNNGNVTFGAAMAAYTPAAMSGLTAPTLAPFWADVDTRASGTSPVTYGAGTVNGHDAFGVNWVDVGYFNQHASLLNRFQLVLVDRSDLGTGAFDAEFNYDRIDWEAGDASGGSDGLGGTAARAGYANGSGVAHELIGSGAAGSLLDAGAAPLIGGSLGSAVAGRYVFRFDGSEVPPVVSLTALGSATEGGDPGAFRLTRTGDLSQPLTVGFAIDPASTASAASDYTIAGSGVTFDPLTLTGSVTFAASQDALDITVGAVDDATTEDTETVTLSLTASSLYDFGAFSTASVNIFDNETPEVSVAATDTFEGAATGGFTLTRIGDLSGPLTVNYTVTGTATSGTDFTALSGSVTFLANASIAAVPVSIIDDSTTEYSEDVVLSLESDTAYALGENSEAAVAIGDNETPLVDLQTDANALEGVSDGRIWFTRRGDLRSVLPVTIAVGGTATSGTDFASLGTTVTFEAGEADTFLDVEALADSSYDPNETVVVTIQAGTGYQYNLVYSATLTIEDAIPLVTVEKITDAWEDGREGGFRFQRTGDVTEALTVYYTISGDATEEADYEDLSGSVEFEAGESEVDVVVTPVDDTAADPGEVVTVTIPTSTEYEVGTRSTDSLMVVDDETQLVTVAKIADGFEGGAGGRFRFTRTGDISGPLTVSYTVSGTATSGTDYTALSGSVTFAAGEATADVSVTLGTDTTAEDTETIIVQVTSGTTYGADPNAIDVVNLVDDDTNAGAIGGVVWTDANEDGIRDTGETLAVGFTVTLRDEWGERLFETLTDSSGAYQFRGLVAGTYSVQFYSPPLDWFTTAEEGSDESVDSNVDVATGWSSPILLATGAMTKLAVGAGFVRAGAPTTPTTPAERVIITNWLGIPLAEDGLRVAKWHDAFEEAKDEDGKVMPRIKGPVAIPSGVGNSHDFIDRDSDRFNVRVYNLDAWSAKDATKPGNPPLNPTLSATIATSNGDGSPYNDAVTTIPLIRFDVPATDKWAGWYWSDSQILVSNDVDDKYQAEGYLGADEAAPDATKKNAKGFAISDRTHKIALGGKVIVTSGDLPAREVTVKIEKTVKLHVTILKDKVDGTQVIAPAKVNYEIAKMREIYSQVGIRVLIVGDDGAEIASVGNAQVKNPPPGVDLDDGKGLDGYEFNDSRTHKPIVTLQPSELRFSGSGGNVPVVA